MSKSNIESDGALSPLSGHQRATAAAAANSGTGTTTTTTTTTSTPTTPTTTTTTTATSFARAARDGMMRAAASFRSSSLESPRGPLGENLDADPTDGDGDGDGDAAAVSVYKRRCQQHQQQQQLATPTKRTMPSSANSSYSDNDQDSEKYGSPQPASPPTLADSAKWKENAAAVAAAVAMVATDGPGYGSRSRAGSGGRCGRRSGGAASPTEITCNNILSGRHRLRRDENESGASGDRDGDGNKDGDGDGNKDGDGDGGNTTRLTGSGCDDADGRPNAFATASAATGLIENAFRVMFASCTTGEHGMVGSRGGGGSTTAMQDAGLAPSSSSCSQWGVAPARSGSDVTSDDIRRPPPARSRSTYRRKKRPSEGAAAVVGGAVGSGPGGSGDVEDDFDGDSSAERHRKQLEGMRRARQEELIRSSSDGKKSVGNDAGNIENGGDHQRQQQQQQTITKPKAKTAGNGAIHPDPSTINKVLQKEVTNAVTLNDDDDDDDGRRSLCEDGESYCYDDGISELTGLTLEEMERHAKLEREMQKRDKRTKQRSGGRRTRTGDADHGGGGGGGGVNGNRRRNGSTIDNGDVAAATTEEKAFDVSFMDAKVLFPIRGDAQRKACPGQALPNSDASGRAPSSCPLVASAPNDAAAAVAPATPFSSGDCVGVRGEDYATSEEGDELGLPPPSSSFFLGQYKFARVRSTHTHGSRVTQGSAKSYSRFTAQSSVSSQSSNDFEAAWRRDEARYWAEEAAKDRGEASGGVVSDGAEYEEKEEEKEEEEEEEEPGLQLETDNAGGNKGGIASLPRPPTSRGSRHRPRTDAVPRSNKGQSRSLKSLRSMELTAPISSSSYCFSLDHRSNSQQRQHPSHSSRFGDGAAASSSLFDQWHHPHDTLPVVDGGVMGPDSGSIGSVGGGDSVGGGIAGGGGVVIGVGGGGGGGKKKRKKKKKSRGMRLHETFVRRGARLIRAGGYYEQHEEDDGYDDDDNDEEVVVLTCVSSDKGGEELAGTVKRLGGGDGSSIRGSVVLSNGDVAEI